MAADGAHRRLAIVVLVLCASGLGAFVILRLLAPFHYTGWDEAYYLGIGANLLSGHGLQTAFGEFPSIHSPLWPLLLQAPPTFLGVDPTSWGHPLVVVSGAIVVGMAGWYAWRSIRLAAPLAVAAMIAFPFLLDLAGWMGLDLPSAALAMLYVGLGIAAVRRGSFSIGLAAGLVFAVAFLVKELVLPFAPVPILAGLVRPTALASIGRAAAGILLAAMLTTSWWFVVYAQELGLVYRLGTPAWTLVPLAVVAFALVAVGLAMPRIAPWTQRPLEGDRGSWTVRLGWVGSLAWAGLLTAYFAVAPNPVGAAFLEPAQIAVSVARLGPDLAPLLSLGLTGSVIAAVDRIRPGRLGLPAGERSPWEVLLQPDDRHAVDDLLIATICGLPFVLLIASVGEGPRHYIANLGFVMALGAIGWTRLLVAVSRRPSPDRLATVALGVLVVLLVAARFAGPSRWLLIVLAVVAVAIAGAASALADRGGARSLTVADVRRRAAAGVVVGVVLAIVVGSAVAVAASALPGAPSPTDTARASVVATSTAWVREHLEPGSSVVFGSGFAMESSIHLIGDYPMAVVAEEPGIGVEASAPVGLVALDGTKAEDWVALWASRRDVTALVGYRARRVVESFHGLGPSVWIQTVLTSEASPSPLLEALDRAQGLEVLERWTWPYGDDRLETVVYRVDPSRLAFSDDIVLDPSALARIVRTMERDPDAYREAAAALLERAVPVSPGPRSEELLDRLRILAAR